MKTGDGEIIIMAPIVHARHDLPGGKCSVKTTSASLHLHGESKTLLIHEIPNISTRKGTGLGYVKFTYLNAYATAAVENKYPLPLNDIKKLLIGDPDIHDGGQNHNVKCLNKCGPHLMVGLKAPICGMNNVLFTAYDHDEYTRRQREEVCLITWDYVQGGELKEIYVSKPVKVSFENTTLSLKLSDTKTLEFKTAYPHCIRTPEPKHLVHKPDDKPFDPLTPAQFKAALLDNIESVKLVHEKGQTQLWIWLKDDLQMCGVPGLLTVVVMTP